MICVMLMLQLLLGMRRTQILLVFVTIIIQLVTVCFVLRLSAMNAHICILECERVRQNREPDHIHIDARVYSVCMSIIHEGMYAHVGVSKHVVRYGVVCMHSIIQSCIWAYAQSNVACVYRGLV